VTFRRSRARPVAPIEKNWFSRHKILSSIAGFLVFISLISQCGESATVADPAPAAETSVALPAPTSAPPAATSAPPEPSPSPTLDPEAQKRAEAERKAEEKARAEAEARKQADAKAAATKQAEAKAKKEAEAKKKGAAAEAKREAAAAEEAKQAQLDERDTFSNCTDMNQTYSHGVGRSGATDETSGDQPVTKFKVSERIYGLNVGSDRDDDGIACEKR